MAEDASNRASSSKRTHSGAYIILESDRSRPRDLSQPPGFRRRRLQRGQDLRFLSRGGVYGGAGGFAVQEMIPFCPSPLPWSLCCWTAPRGRLWTSHHLLGTKGAVAPARPQLLQRGLIRALHGYMLWKTPEGHGGSKLALNQKVRREVATA